VNAPGLTATQQRWHTPYAFQTAVEEQLRSVPKKRYKLMKAERGKTKKGVTTLHAKNDEKVRSGGNSSKVRNNDRVEKPRKRTKSGKGFGEEKISDYVPPVPQTPQCFHYRLILASVIVN
jgi:hypothetical protein